MTPIPPRTIVASDSAETFSPVRPASNCTPLSTQKRLAVDQSLMGGVDLNPNVDAARVGAERTAEYPSDLDPRHVIGARRVDPVSFSGSEHEF
jgi:hypothetical protein